MLFSLRSFVQPVPVSCWLTIMNQCVLDLGSFQPLLLYCCRTRVEIHRSSCVCVDMSALMESMHRSTFDFPVLKSPVLIIYSFPFYVDKTLKQTCERDLTFYRRICISADPSDGTKKESEGAMREHSCTVMYHSTCFRNVLWLSKFRI